MRKVLNVWYLEDISISRYLDYTLLLWVQEFEYLYASFYLNI